MTSTIHAPTARTDWHGVALGGILVAALTTLGAAWAAYSLLGGVALTPRGAAAPLGRFWWYVATHRDQLAAATWAVQTAVYCPLGLGALAGLVAALKLSTPMRAEIHHEGGRLRTGAAAAKAVVAGEAARSPVDISLACVPFTRDRLRRSITIFGSPGGGKTQIIWHLMGAAGKAGYRMLVVDGPKGDYSTQMLGNPLIVAPWHAGPAWDVARDCPTRNHARELARALIPVSEKDPLWGNAAGMVFVACVCKLQAERGQQWGWGDLLDLIMLPVADLKPIAETHYPPAAQAVADAESKTTQSIVINLTAFMQDVFEMALAWRGTPQKFAFTDWWRGAPGPQLVILQGSGEFASLAGGYIAAIVKMIAALTASPTFADSPDRKNLIVIDELAQLPKLERLEKFMEIGRSKGCPCVLATQSPAQLRKIYGEDDLAAWMGMAGSRLFVRTSGAADLAFVGRELGERKVYVPTQSRTLSASGTAVSDAFAQETQPVVTGEYLSARLGPTPKMRIRFLAQLAADPVELEVPILTQMRPIRPVFTPNPKFNAPLQTVAAQPIAASEAHYCTAPEAPETPPASAAKAEAVAAPGALGEAEAGAADAELAAFFGVEEESVTQSETVAAQAIPESLEHYCTSSESAPADDLGDVLDFLAAQEPAKPAT